MNNTRDQLEARLDVVINDMQSIQDEIGSGSYPNWYPETLRQRKAEYRALVYKLAEVK